MARTAAYLAPLALAASAAGATPASAPPLRVPDGALRMWAQAAQRRGVLVPTNYVIQDGVAADAVGAGAARAGVGGQPSTIYLDPSRILEDDPKLRRREARLDFLHELGHVLDYQVADNKMRGTFQAIMKRPGDPTWHAGSNSPHEQFAEAYSLVASGMPWSHAQNHLGNYALDLTRSQYIKLQKLFSGGYGLPQATPPS